MRGFLLAFALILTIAASYTAVIDPTKKEKNVEGSLLLESVDSETGVHDNTGKRVTRQFGFGFPGYGYGYRPYYGGFGGYGFRPYFGGYGFRPRFGGFGYRPFGYGFYG